MSFNRPSKVLWIALLAAAPLARADLSPSSASGEEVWRIDCGTDDTRAYPDDTNDYAPDAQGRVWLRDEPYNGRYRWGYTAGSTAVSGNQIDGTDSQVIYRTHRYSSTGLSYRVAVPNGVYRVKLMFAETSGYLAHQRVFNVALEGVPVLTGLDVYGDVGPNKADDYVFNTTVADGVLDVDLSTGTAGDAMIAGIEASVVHVSDDEFLDFVQKKMFYYVWNHFDPGTGLLPPSLSDWSGVAPSTGDVAVTGLGMAVAAVAAHHGWVTSAQAENFITKALTTFTGNQRPADGFWYQPMEIATGDPQAGSAVSPSDSALFIAGALQAGEYFRASNPSIAQTAEELYGRMDWPAVDLSSAPPAAVLLAVGSSAHPAPASLWTGMARHWTSSGGTTFIDGWSLLSQQLLNVFFDFRNLSDGLGVNYFQNLQSATLANRSFCLTDPNGWYGPDHWGISRCYGPDGVVRDYTPATGDGTVDPTAALLSLPLTPTESLAAVRSMFFQYKHYIFGIHGFCDGFNVKRNSRAPVADGVDLCASILAVENYRTGMPRTYFMKSPIARQALNAAGFASPSRCTASSSLRSAALACDGDDGTSWESAAFDPQWLQVDLLTAQIIGKVELDWGADYGLSYRIQVSPDGTTWRDVAGTDHGHGGHEALFFAPVTARYVRVYGNQSAAGGGCSVQEMWVLPPAVSGPKAFPNPFRPALGHRAVTLSNLPSGAHVRIHAFSGVLVAELTTDAFGSASWNGTNASGAAVASGVYTAVVEGFGEKLKIIVQR